MQGLRDKWPFPYPSIENSFHLEGPLTPKGPKHYLAPKSLKTAISTAITQETKKNFFGEI